MDLSSNLDGFEIAPTHPPEAGPSSNGSPRSGFTGKKISKSMRSRLRRNEKIQRIANDAVERWNSVVIGSKESIQRRLPRPWRFRYEDGGRLAALPPIHREIVFKAGIFKSAARLHLWLLGGLRLVMGLAQLWFRRSLSHENSAILLRETLTDMGPTFIKLGQQLSMRMDLLPVAYTSELEKLLDELEPFPTETAMKTIEQAVGKKTGSGSVPCETIFSAFDYEPIGSASVACVYKAILKDGTHVAVKVRRPGIGPLLAADMRALKWLMLIFEVILLNPGFLKNLNHELRTMLMEELDFRKEARFAELYRRRMRKTKQMRFVSVPRIFFEYSTDEVMVSEFVSGIWMKDILAGLTTNDQKMTSLLDKMNVDPIILARRIQLIARYNNFENIFFHADLHPGNILIQPGNKICLIDFGSCGSFSRRELNAWRRWFDAQSVDDVGGMVQAALAIIEPLPPIDKDEFGQRLESEFWKNLYAIKSKHSDWAERIPSRLWMDFLKLCREYSVPMRLNTLRMIRASMLTDTIAGRLDPDQDSYREFRYYEKGAAKRAKKRVVKRVDTLFSPSKFIRLEQGIESALQLAFQVQRIATSVAGIRIGALITKFAYLISLMLRHVAWIFITLTVFTIGFYLLGYEGDLTFYCSRCDHLEGLPRAFLAVLVNPWWLIIAFAPSAIIMWRVYFRIRSEREYPN